MAIAFVSAASAAGSSLTLPSHAKGDLIVATAFRNNNLNTVVVPPSQWETVLASFTSNNHAYIFQRIAQSSAESNPTFSDAAAVACCVYRSGNVIVASNATVTQATIGSGGSIFYTQAITTSATTNKWFGGVFTSRVDDSDGEQAPSGMTQRTFIEPSSPAGCLAMHDTNGNLASWPQTSITLGSGTTTRVQAIVYEIIETAQSLSSGGVRQVNIRGGADQ